MTNNAFYFRVYIAKYKNNNNAKMLLGQMQFRDKITRDNIIIRQTINYSQYMFYL